MKCCMCESDAVAGVYCQAHLDDETGGLSAEELEAAASFLKPFRCTCQSARKRGAIGVFYRVEAFFYAPEAASAEHHFREAYECNAPVQTGRVPD